MSVLFAVAGCMLSLAGCSSLSPPVTDLQIGAFATDVTGALAETSPPFAGVLDADLAVSRAIAFNQRLHAARFEAAIEDARLRVERGELLPDIVSQSEYYRRNKPLLTHSNASNFYSSSSDIETLSRSIELSFNVIDFGLTLLRMRQAGDRANMKYEDVRRVSLQITEETRAVYWRAVALQTLLPELARSAKDVNDALELSRRATADPALDPTDSINYQRDLLNTRRELNDIFSNISGADYQLKTLAGIPAGNPLKLDAERDLKYLRSPPPAAEDDVARALRQRPEIRQHMYQLRITGQEVDAAILKILPGATLTQSFMSDSNSHLLYGDWVSWSARLAVSLIEIVRLPARLDEVNANLELERQNAIVTAAAIAMQVHVARAKLAVQFHVYRDAEEYAQNQKALYRQVQNAVAAGKLPEQLIARERLAALLAQIRAIVAFGELQAAQAAYEAALGDTIPGEIAGLNE